MLFIIFYFLEPLERMDNGRYKFCILHFYPLLMLSDRLDSGSNEVCILNFQEVLQFVGLK
jgi:hypothetical protein